MGAFSKAGGDECGSTRERIAVVEARSLLASGLVALISGHRGERSEVLSFSSPDLVPPAEPDVLVIGPGWAGPAVPQLLREAFKSPSRIRAVLIEPMHAQTSWRPRGGCLLRISDDCAPDSLLESVDTLFETCDPKDREVAGLSKREAILTFIRDGLTNQDIASRLHLSESAVKWHVSKLLRSVGARNRTELVRISIRAGLLRDFGAHEIP